MRTLALLDRLAARAAERPDAPAVANDDGRPVDRATLVRRVRALARGLVAAGLAPGDRVLFAVRPSVEAIVAILAVVEAGGVLVAAEVGTGSALFAARMALVRPRWVIGESLLLAAAGSRVARAIARRRGVDLPSLDALREARLVRVGPWLPGMRGARAATAIERAGVEAPHVALPAAREDAPAFVVFTSGTTAAPRAVVHTQRSLRATLDVVGASLAVADGDVLYAGELHLALPALLAGARVVVPPRGALDPAATIRALAAHGATHTFLVPADAQRVADHLAARGAACPSTLRHLLLGAAPVEVPLLRRLRAVLPPSATAWAIYGMTEILPVATVSIDEKLAWTGEGDLLGAPVPGIEARVADDGELLLRGPQLCAGYLGEPEMTEHATGDVVRVDEHGRLVLLGRAKDMIIRGHHNVYPALHEPVVARIPGVRRCAMVGVRDDRASDERIVLVVEPDAGTDAAALARALPAALRAEATRIDDAALPDRILVMALPEVGRSRKIDRAALRALAGRALRETAERA
ncbi:class I adenylate-forming enzyme family protein [Roseisolibacter agri]|uniref:Fatty-acyl-CoA synthase n=1 Tax=Roseisolibacter agri TaxID=2014610 RepID=A0AA37Q3D7_9BACT|nr:class I adenylate-forming enzyme family protein [Roseisolibacter agri]GLC25644.1 fatty-acyl-CoA synthase [Roseisolibacter agri]